MGSPDVLSSVGHDFPSLAAGPTCPPGAGSGRAWPPGLQRRAQEVGVERAGGRGRGQGALGAEAGLSQSRRGKRNRLGRLDAGREGVAGKARESCRPGTRPPPFFGSLALREGLRIRTTYWRKVGASRASGYSSVRLTSKGLRQSRPG